MKKLYISSSLFLLFLTGFTQGTMSLIHPFNTPIAQNQIIQMATDTSGLVWFAAADTTGDSLVVTNENHSASYSFAISGTLAYLSIMADSRGGIWLTFGSTETPVFWIHDSIAQQFNLYTPDSSSINAFGAMADNHKGIDYFFYEASYPSFPNRDSLFVVAFDGNTSKVMNLKSVLAPDDTINPTVGGIFCDYQGNLYIFTSAKYTYKYDGINWGISPINLDSVDVNFCSYNNRFFENTYFVDINTISPTGQVSPIYNCGPGNLLGSYLFQNRDSSIWLVNQTELLKYEGGTFVLKASSEFYVGHYTPYGNATFDAVGNILMGTYNNGNAILVYNIYGNYLVEGGVFIDANQNGIHDSGEAYVSGVNVAQSPDNTVANTDSAGNYNILFLLPYENCTVSFSCPQYYHTTTPAAYTLTADSNIMCCYNFGIAPNGVIQDLQVNAAPDFAIPGYINQHWLSYQNTGTTTVSDTVVYQFDARYTYVNSYPLADVVQGNTVKWAYSNLVPFEIRNLSVTLQLDSTIVAGTQLYDTATIYPLGGDSTLANNVYDLQQTAYTSFDPNHKTVDPAGLINRGQVLTFTVYFQNTGSSPAVNVVINDTLDPSLNFSTFKLLGNSSPVKYQLKGNGIVQFTFSNIQLPDSASNPSGSLGYVRYSIEASSHLYYGEDVKNTAYINFDFNTPVATNTTNSFYGVSAVNEIVKGSDANVYPNPSTTGWFLSVDQSLVGSPFEILDMDGRLIYHSEIRQPFTELSVMAAGVYLLRIQGSNGVIVKKMVKI